MRVDRLVAAMLPVLRHVRGQPGAELVAELDFFRGQIQIHVALLGI